MSRPNGSQMAGILVLFLLLGIALALVLKFSIPLSDWLAFNSASVGILVGAIIIGDIGSLAYYTALNFGYIGGTDRDVLMTVFAPKHKVIWFMIIGGGVAGAFQLAQIGSFAPIQSFVLGITWPTLVSDYLAGKGKD